MPDGPDHSELQPRKEPAKLPVKMVAETIAKNTPNQDSYFINPTRAIAGVFDGMGGHAGGETASYIGRKSIEATLSSNIPRTVEEAKEIMDTAFSRAQENLLFNAKTGLEGMGTTGTVVQIIENGDGHTAIIGNIGDSRAYVFRNNKLEAVTIDDSLFTQNRTYQEAKIAQERLSNIVANDSAEAQNYFNTRNKILTALGSKDGIRPNIYTVNLQPGDKLILTTDGVHDNLTDRDIEATMKANPSPENATNLLTRNAKTISEMGKESYPRSKKDDITAVVIEIEEKSQISKSTIPSVPNDASVIPGAAEQSGRIQKLETTEQQNDLFGKANSPGEVLKVLYRTRGIQGTKTYFNSPDLQRLFLEVLSGDQPLTLLTRSEGLRDAAARILEKYGEKPPSIHDAKSPDDLINSVAFLKGVEGSKEWFSNWDLAILLKGVFEKRFPINCLPRTDGIRQKAEEILKEKLVAA